MGEYRACQVCEGAEEYTWDEEMPEICQCEDMDGVDDEGRTLITRRAMMQLRRRRWENDVNWDPEDLDRVFTAREVLQEDVQDQTIPMVIVGTDVESLYPNLIIKKVVEEVREAVMESEMVWEEVDYLEMAR